MPCIKASQSLVNIHDIVVFLFAKNSQPTQRMQNCSQPIHMQQQKLQRSS